MFLLCRWCCGWMVCVSFVWHRLLIACVFVCVYVCFCACVSLCQSVAKASKMLNYVNYRVKVVFCVRLSVVQFVLTLWCLSVCCLSIVVVCLSVSLSSLSVVSICLSVSLSLCLCLFVCVSVCLRDPALQVTIQDSRMLVGTFMAFDRHMNLVLGDCEEQRVLRSKKGSKSASPLPFALRRVCVVLTAASASASASASVQRRSAPKSACWGWCCCAAKTSCRWRCRARRPS